MLRTAADVASEIAGDYPNPIVPEAIKKYFGLLYWNEKRSHGWDSRGVLPCFKYDPYDKAQHKLAPFKFRSAAEAYQLIRDEQTPVVVPYDQKADKLIARLATGAAIDYDFYKAVQQYSVGVRDDLLQKLVDNANLIQHVSGVWYLANPRAYSPEKGMLPDVAGMGPEALIS